MAEKILHDMERMFHLGTNLGFDLLAAGDQCFARGFWHLQQLAALFGYIPGDF
ncbi:hypothetical protein GCM10008110_00730 [Marinobacter persicus]|nr:hypothetical protein GCM10008110_00730 [Marinobacter persicus]